MRATHAHVAPATVNVRDPRSCTREYTAAAREAVWTREAAQELHAQPTASLAPACPRRRSSGPRSRRSICISEYPLVATPLVAGGISSPHGASTQYTRREGGCLAHSRLSAGPARSGPARLPPRPASGAGPASFSWAGPVHDSLTPVASRAAPSPTRRQATTPPPPDASPSHDAPTPSAPLSPPPLHCRAPPRGRGAAP